MNRARLDLCTVLVLSAATILCPAAHALIQSDWVARYNGPANGYDSASGLAVDAAGNVFVTGSTPGSGGASDFAIVKYDASGNELWAVRYNGPGDFNDYAQAVALDPAGHVYVTGESTGPHDAGGFGAYDYATIKYDSDGNQLWAAVYNGPADGWDYPVAMTVDSAGNVYVTGYQTGADGVSDADYATIKYDSDGNQLWAAVYNGPAGGSDHAAAIAVDAAGHVYVTGSSAGLDGRPGYATIKYGSDGNQLWAARNSLGAQDHAAAIAVDAAGHVSVTGASCTPHGLPPPDLVNCVYATVTYDNSGNLLWSATYHGLGDVFAPSNQAVALALDDSGNVYVTGSSEASATASDYATIKYDRFGSVVWVARYNGPANGSDSAAAIAVDAAGRIYVTGSSAGSDGSLDVATVQYDADGNELGVTRYSGPAREADIPCALAADSSGNVYVTGTSQSDFLTLKLSTASENGNGGDSGGGGGGGGCFIGASSQSPAGLSAGMLIGLVFCWIMRKGPSRYLRGVLQ